jgi:hypothetical protein
MIWPTRKFGGTVNNYECFASQMCLRCTIERGGHLAAPFFDSSRCDKGSELVLGCMGCMVIWLCVVWVHCV